MTNVVAYNGEVPLKSGTLQAPADWSGTDSTFGTFQFKVVDIDTSAQNLAKLFTTGAVNAGAGRSGLGVLMNAPKSGEACQVAVIGEVKVQAGASLSIGDPLMVDSHGRVITATTGKVSIGVAMMPANAANDVITIIANFLNTDSAN